MIHTVTDLQIDCEPQGCEPSCLGMFHSASLAPHSAQASSASLSESYGRQVKSLSEDKTDNIACSPLIYQHGLFIGEGYQVVKSLQSLGESMLTPDLPCTWKCFPGLAAPSPSQEPRKGCLASIFLGLL